MLAQSANRCGKERTFHTTTAPSGQPVAVPQPDRSGTLLLVRVEGADPHGLERLTALLLRPSRRWVALDDQRFRLVAATAADGLLLRVPRDADYPERYALAPNPAYIAVGREGSQPGGELRYTFVEIPIGRFSRGTRPG
ncbi:MAG: hypothetical protein WBC33_07405 [Conexibacter sp.]